MVEKVKPKEIRTVHGYAQEFAMDLQERGWRAWALAGETQLVLPLGGSEWGRKESERVAKGGQLRPVKPESMMGPRRRFRGQRSRV